MAAASFCGFNSGFQLAGLGARVVAARRRARPSARSITIGTDDTIGDGASANKQLEPTAGQHGWEDQTATHSVCAVRNSLSGGP